ncbi:hypothetical protein [Actinokineospora pegani]|uniref:hypothetical protein n=1 Tax=Actinokineospora pegani TaxID=2654637 RepID=UPI0012EA679E|nr:hypothetical protein [Actinokineospora pegani]
MAEYTLQRFHNGASYEFARVRVEVEDATSDSAVTWDAELGSDLLYRLSILLSGIARALTHHQRVTGRRAHVHITGFVGNDVDVTERAAVIAAQMATNLALGYAEEDFDIVLHGKPVAVSREQDWEVVWKR